MKCPKCSKEMEVRQTKDGTFALCRDCKVKKKLSSVISVASDIATPSVEPKLKKASKVKQQQSEALAIEQPLDKAPMVKKEQKKEPPKRPVEKSLELTQEVPRRKSTDSVEQKPRKRKRPQEEKKALHVPAKYNTYGNIPDEEIRRKKEKHVKSSYEAMISAGNPNSRKRKGQKKPQVPNKPKRTSHVLRNFFVTVFFLLFFGGSILAGLYFFTSVLDPLFPNKGEGTNVIATHEEIDTFSLKGKNFKATYVSSEQKVDTEGKPCLLVYYDYENTGTETPSSALADILLIAKQNGSELNIGYLQEELPEMIAFRSEVLPGEKKTVCQVFTLNNDSDVTLVISELLLPNPSTQTQIVPLTSGANQEADESPIEDPPVED